MDGRWKLALAGGFLAGAIGCNTTSKRPGDLFTASTRHAPGVKYTQTPPNVPPPPAEPPRTSLKPSTYVQIAASTAEAANQPDRPPPQRAALLRQSPHSLQ